MATDRRCGIVRVISHSVKDGAMHETPPRNPRIANVLESGRR
jgi:hypothetical protein